DVHLTFFEMLGNWSLGDYWKRDAITWSFEFLTKELKLDPKRIYVTVFGGDPKIPGVTEDKESIEIWKSLGIRENRIYKLGKKDNWWGPVGATGPCGPDTEMFYDTGRKEHGEKCQPGETCGKYAEIWNDVFMEYNKTTNGRYEPLKQKNVDTGMGVERTVAILQRKDNVYDTELFKEVIDLLREKSKNSFNLRDARVIADHMRAAVFIASEDIEPSNKKQGYILRRLIRRSAARSIYSLNMVKLPFEDILDTYVEIFNSEYPELNAKKDQIWRTLNKEIVQFDRTIEQAVKEFKKIKDKSIKQISGPNAFYLHATHGLTIDIVKDWALGDSLAVDEKGFEEEFKKHQEVSRVDSRKFTGGLADHSEITVRGHTATHLLHQALRNVLGDQVHQTGSNITPERIRFDFAHGEKLTELQIKKVEQIVNTKIKEDLPVKKELMSQEQADKVGAIGLFRDNYGDKVSIYQIGDYSTEFCGGPHVEHTSQVGKFKIVKEEALGIGQRRIRAILN
ncbi:alanine--tRNA ligase, partial [Patescibacteria group bacterium]|nr:alanine--tRNA ligase [Patescibacteria group bacterium]